MKLPSKRNMCANKATFRTKGKAENVAQRFGQRVYECPVCFCWHLTSKENWKLDYVPRHVMEKALQEQESVLRQEMNKIKRDRAKIIHGLQCKLAESEKAKDDAYWAGHDDGAEAGAYCD